MNRNRKGVIYAHINKVNGEKYIGQTIQTLQERFRKEGNGYKACTKFYNAIQKYGWDNFEHIVLECGLDDEEMDYKEKYWISYYDSIAKGYNIDLGGANQHMSDEHKLKIQNSHLKHARKIICVNNGNIYNSIQEARRLTGIEHIWDCCVGKLHSAGSDENGYALIWKFLDEYDKDENYVVKKQYKTNKPVICITTGDIYSCIREASQKLNIDDGSISRCCNGKRLTAGSNEKGQLLSWKYLCDYQSNMKENVEINCKQRHLFIHNINISIDDYIRIHLYALNKLSVPEYKLLAYCMSSKEEDFSLSSKYIMLKINLSESACYNAIHGLINYGFIIKNNDYGCYVFNNDIVKSKILPIYCDFTDKLMVDNKYSANNFKINNINQNLYNNDKKLNKIIKNILPFMPTKSLVFKLFMYMLLYFLQNDNCLIIHNKNLYEDIGITHDSISNGLLYLIKKGYLKKEKYGKKVYYLDLE